MRYSNGVEAKFIGVTNVDASSPIGNTNIFYKRVFYRLSLSYGGNSFPVPFCIFFQGESYKDEAGIWKDENQKWSREVPEDQNIQSSWPSEVTEIVHKLNNTKNCKKHLESDNQDVFVAIG